MALVESDERTAVDAVAQLTDCNPFLPERVELEKKLLGDAFIPIGVVWYAEGEAGTFDPNLPQLRQRVEDLAAVLQGRLAAGVHASDAELTQYRSLIFYLLWLRYEDDWLALIRASEATRSAPKRVDCYDRFLQDVVHFLALLPGPKPDAAHLFALGFQTRRAFYHIFRKIFGASLPAALLRARVWRSIFTRNAARYRSSLWDRMADIPTLIIGESGSGKELVARAIALSQYIPFDPSTRSFVANPAAGFAAVNLSALSATLIESELFGHRRGAFTGAVEDHSGWFERCGPYGAVFLDEIGELDGAIQVKLLRVLQSREFHRLGDAEPRRFSGKLIAATNRDIGQEIDAGRFREDLYYRICADFIRMPTLREQLAANPDDLRSLLTIIARRTAGEAAGQGLAEEAHAWAQAQLAGHIWRGNMRELEQCVRNILIDGEYYPRHPEPARPDAADELTEAIRHGTITADELLTRYCMLIYAQTRSVRETARRLGMDRRTVAARLKAAKLAVDEEEE